MCAREDPAGVASTRAACGWWLFIDGHCSYRVESRPFLDIYVPWICTFSGCLFLEFRWLLNICVNRGLKGTHTD